jgi:hypothetical protein
LVCIPVQERVAIFDIGSNATKKVTIAVSITNKIFTNSVICPHAIVLIWTSDVNVYYPFDIVWVITGISAVALVVIPNDILIPIHDIDFNTGM